MFPSTPNPTRAEMEPDPTTRNPKLMDPFDLCPTPKVSRLNRSLLAVNKEKRELVKLTNEGVRVQRLRDGMVLLKRFLCFDDQIAIIRKCRDLGVGPGGFYRPRYSEETKMNLHMMCLGKNWDPKNSYEDIRTVDGAKPPEIPDNLGQLVQTAVQCASGATGEPLGFSPDVCIINYYSESGKLGLHQDRDESPTSLRKGLPVVSFSIGDTADFVFGDKRDVNAAETIKLESGDVLIFGGKSRHIFHGVSKIHPDTGWKILSEETKIRPGRLNLTFRQY